MSLLTFDNPPLSGPKNGGDQCSGDVIAHVRNDNFDHSVRLPEHLRALVRDSLSDNSRRAYASDLARFEAWGGAIPTTAEVVAEYFASHADSHAVASLARWKASLGKAHRAIDADDPTKSELVKSVMRGIMRRKGLAQNRAKPLLRDDLFALLDALGNDLRDARDRALILMGFAGGFRRSELVGLDVPDIGLVKQGIIVTIRRSKTDQLGEGRKIGIPHARGRHCPVAALEVWQTRSGIKDGPVFRSVDRHMQFGAKRLSAEAVALALKDRLSAIGIDPTGYSGHSLRAGFVTSAAQAGVSSWKIRAQTGHKTEEMLARYIREGELFLDNAAGTLL